MIMPIPNAAHLKTRSAGAAFIGAAGAAALDDGLGLRHKGIKPRKGKRWGLKHIHHGAHRERRVLHKFFSANSVISVVNDLR